MVRVPRRRRRRRCPRADQRDLAARVGICRKALEDWESGANYPAAERPQSAIRVLLEAGDLTDARAASEARKRWAAAEREAQRMHTPLDWTRSGLHSRSRPTRVRPTPEGAYEAVQASLPRHRGLARSKAGVPVGWCAIPALTTSSPSLQATGRGASSGSDPLKALERRPTIVRTTRTNSAAILSHAKLSPMRLYNVGSDCIGTIATTSSRSVV
jgi:DNA-binding XRE family transcriptional regulator